MSRRAFVAALLVLASFACASQGPAPATAPTPGPSGEPGVVNLIDDDRDNRDENRENADSVPGADVEYGKYAPGSR